MRFTTGIAAAVGSSLKLKLVLIIVAILGLTVGIAPWSAIRTQQSQLLAASQDRLRSLHEMLRNTIVATCMLTGERESVQQVIQAVGSHHNLGQVRLFDTRGVIQYSSRPDERGTRLSHAELSHYYGAHDPVLRTEGNGSTTLALAQPMFNNAACNSCHAPEQKILGILEISLSLDQTSQLLTDLKRSALLATIMTLGVIVIGIWLSLTVLVDRPLHRLVTVMSRAEHGDLSARADTRSEDELGQVARHFNDMISKLESAQEELELYHQEQLARADRLATIGEMAAAIAHEIRNPLTGISGAVSVLSRDFSHDDPRHEIVQNTHQLIDRLNKSVEDILHYSRPSQPQLRAAKLADIVDQSIALVEGEARKARVHILRDCAPETGDDDGSPTVNVDPQQIQQVLVNLVLNAIQATGAGGQIRVRTYANENHAGPHSVCVEIEDNGTGMTEEEVTRAFQPFFSTKSEGTGLGLPIAKQIIEQHQGRISLRSAPGQGTHVVVELPGQGLAPTNGT